MINCLMAKEKSEEDPSKMIYDLPKCFMITWEELMGMTTAVGYDIWSEDVTKTTNYPTSTNGGRHFKPLASYQAPTYRGGDTSNPNQMTRHPHMGGDTSNPRYQSK